MSLNDAIARREPWAVELISKRGRMRRSYESPIRDLNRKLQALAQTHLAFPQVQAVMGNLGDHLQAIAFAEETNRREAARAHQNADDKVLR